MNEPIMTRHDEMVTETERLESNLKSKQETRITLDIGGRHFATSRETLLTDKKSIFNILLAEEKQHYFIDRNGALFRYILNYLQEGCEMNITILPRKNRESTG